jgi:hypothetical protein
MDPAADYYGLIGGISASSSQRAVNTRVVFYLFENLPFNTIPEACRVLLDEKLRRIYDNVRHAQLHAASCTVSPEVAVIRATGSSTQSKSALPGGEVMPSFVTQPEAATSSPVTTAQGDQNINLGDGFVPAPTIPGTSTAETKINYYENYYIDLGARSNSKADA